MGGSKGQKAAQRRLRVARLALGVSLGLLVIKLLAYRLTGSAAVLSDALESIVNVIASGFALYSVMLSAKPPDASHPYGHGKVEFFSAGFEGALIVMAALTISATAIPRLWAPPPLTQLTAGLLLICGAALVNVILGVYLQAVGRRTSSLTLIADGRHVLSDSYTSGGVLVGMLLVRLTGWYILDALVALLVAVHILITGGRLVRTSVAGLMDEAEPAFLRQILRLMRAHRQTAWIDVHQLRAWRSGSRYHVDFHLTLPRYWDLEQGHRVAQQVEDLIHEHQSDSGDVIIHLDPCFPAHCPVCEVGACPVRAAPHRETAPWTLAAAVGTSRPLVSDPARR